MYRVSRINETRVFLIILATKYWISNSFFLLKTEIRTLRGPRYFSALVHTLDYFHYLGHTNPDKYCSKAPWRQAHERSLVLVSAVGAMVP